MNFKTSSISKQFPITKFQIFSFREDKCSSVWNYDKNISTSWKKCTFKFCSSWVSLWLSLKTRSDIFWDLFPVITFWHIFSKWSPWPSMIFSIRLIENPYLVTLVGPWISLLPKTTTIYQLDYAYMLETQMSIDFLDIARSSWSLKLCVK